MIETISKTILVEIDLPVRRETCINYEPGIWKHRINWCGVTVAGSDGLTGYYENEGSSITKIESCYVDDVVYLKCDTIESLRLQPEGFLFNQAEQAIYFHFTDSGLPLGRLLRLGATSGFCDAAIMDESGRPIGSTYEGIYYDPRVLSVPSVGMSKDPLFFGIQEYIGGSVELNNSDGFFDGWLKDDIYGQPTRILSGDNGADYSTFVPVITGFIDEPVIDRETLTIQVTDPRAFLSRKLPVNVFNTTDYPSIDEDLIDVFIPVVYGKAKNAPCYLISEVARTYKFMDTEFHSAHSLDYVYVDGEQVTPSSYDLDEGTFVVSALDFDAGSEVTATFVGCEDDDGNAITNGLDVITDIMTNYGGKAYIAENYVISEWIHERAKARSCALWLGDGEELTIQEAIEAICVACDGMFYAKGDGRYSFRSYDDDRFMSRTIYPDEFISTPKTSVSSEFASSCVVLYDRDLGEDKYLHHRNTDYEAAVVEVYKQRKEKEYETVLYNLTDATAKAETIMLLSKQKTEVVERKLPLAYLDMCVMDFITTSHHRPGLASDWAVYELVNITHQLSAGETTVKMRRVRDYVEPVYLYDQGILWGEYLFGDKLFAETRVY